MTASSNFSKYRNLFLIFLSSIITFNSFGQSRDETLDYINTKQDVYKHKNNAGDIFQYAINTSNANGASNLIIVEIASVAGTIVTKDYYIVDIKNITAVEYALDEIGRKQIKIFAKSPGFVKQDLLNNVESYETLISLTFSIKTESEQIKSLIKSYKHLIKLLGGKDLSKEMF